MASSNEQNSTERNFDAELDQVINDVIMLAQEQAQSETVASAASEAGAEEPATGAEVNAEAAAAAPPPSLEAVAAAAAPPPSLEAAAAAPPPSLEAAAAAPPPSLEAAAAAPSPSLEAAAAAPPPSPAAAAAAPPPRPEASAEGPEGRFVSYRAPSKILVKQSLRIKLKALRSYRKGQRSLCSKYEERQAYIEKQQNHCASYIMSVFQDFRAHLHREEEKMLKSVEEDANKLSGTLSEKRVTLHNAVLRCDEEINSVMCQFDSQRLYGSTMYIPAVEQEVCPDLFLNEAHYLGNLRHRDPNTAAACVKVSRDLRAVTFQYPAQLTPFPQRIEWAPGVVASQAVSPHDTLQFTVYVGDHPCFEIGLTSAMANLRGPRPNSAQLLLLSRRGSHFFWNSVKKSFLWSIENVERITVLYNGLLKMLTFTDPNNGFVLHRCSTEHIKDPLFPFLAVDQGLNSRVQEIRLLKN
ncbi:hypothetical protein WMY93_030538 [Mugilogobius chulae]|uniref:Uncharacterized protein n=1 Tax=Mugilogobius chulae TaxID=88201 RepID=A0AAW0MFL6_9GOBI